MVFYYNEDGSFRELTMNYEEFKEVRRFKGWA